MSCTMDVRFEYYVCVTILGKGPLNALKPTPDMDRTVSRRSEPSSRTALMGKQANPWNILQPLVAKSRH